MNDKKFRDWEKTKISQIRIVKLEKDKPEIPVNCNYDEQNFLQFPIILTNTISNTNSVPSRLYGKKLHIQQTKKKDVMNLCKKNVIPSTFMEEYLAMSSSGDVLDNLAETDEGDHIINRLI